MWARAMEVGKPGVHFEKASLDLWFEDPPHRPVSAGLRNGACRALALVKMQVFKGLPGVTSAHIGWCEGSGTSLPCVP